MRLLVIGGCGHVGSFVVPVLARTHELRVLDMKSPRTPVSGVDYHTGDLHDEALVASLASGADSVVFMAMGPTAGWDSPETARLHFDVAVSGLYLALRGAVRAGVRHVVYTSSMSVYRYPDAEIFTFPDESTPPDATDFYGLAKRLGEEVCRTATVEHGIDALCLRLCFPMPDEEWPRNGRPRERAISTSGRDTASAIDAALGRRGHGFDVYAISGDGTGKMMSLAKAERELGWSPRDVT
ncbi:NAD-dependent epimerase/dehydratase family protein [Actinophytocola oryzae]|uniref:NAD-dependent epimerase/dehydratase family protein n=1 Tax=Actinophytocola oryzae TaxID=502181 RepID=A0A4R7VUX4_9PSEU|nr:NAD(P)-dependent oxidoreductase [Actinophytocola oryzae]TDV53793.1 NAD-dependent epimerase/dehydratase family protein [Actinophytocola oryzae]